MRFIEFRERHFCTSHLHEVGDWPIGDIGPDGLFAVAGEQHDDPELRLPLNP